MLGRWNVIPSARSLFSFGKYYSDALFWYRFEIPGRRGLAFRRRPGGGVRIRERCSY